MNYLIEYKEGIWKKIKDNFYKFLNIFKKKHDIHQNCDSHDEQISKEELNLKDNRSTFIEQLQTDVKNEKAKDELLDEVEKNFNLIYTFPTERLDQISLLYNERINKVKARIEKKRLMLKEKQQLLVNKA